MPKRRTGRTSVPGSTRRRVGELIDKGLSSREIADLLGISTQAVYQHIARLERDRREGAA